MRYRTITATIHSCIPSASHRAEVTNTAGDHETSLNVPLLAGGVVAGVLLVAAAAVGVYYRKRRVASSRPVSVELREPLL